MKKRFLILCAVVLASFISVSGQDRPSAFGGKSGIFVFCGKILPKDFSYLISRREAGGTEWKEVATLSFPENENAWQGRLMQNARFLPEGIFPDSATQGFLWKKLKIVDSQDSLYNWANQPVTLAANGTGWWDMTAKAGIRYEYQIERKVNSNVAVLGTTTAVTYPGNKPVLSLIPDTLRGDGHSVTVRFYLDRYDDLSGIKVFRTYYLRNEPYGAIHPEIVFTADDTSRYVSFTDYSVVERAQYSYYVVPFDIYGNESNPSDTVNVFNKRLNTISPVISSLTGTSDEERNQIRLSWQVTNRGEVIAVDIYKALSYDGYYTNIATVSADDTVFFDRNVTPVTTYFYSVVAQTAYGRTFPSVRTPVVLAGNRPNPFPPMGLEARRTGDVVHLSWNRTAADTRGYYLYRTSSYTGEMMPVGPVILNSDSVVTFTDSLKNAPPSAVLVYAVASENTSYAISPLSNRVSVPGRSRRLPVPTGVRAMAQDEVVQVFWDEMADEFPEIAGYRIMRKELDEDNNTITGSEKIFFINIPGINALTDTTAEEGHHYVYTVQSTGLNEEDSSAFSLQAGVHLFPDILPAPNNIIAAAEAQGVRLGWDLPIGGGWERIKIYRAQPGQSPALIETLSANTIEFIDNNVENNQDYFYWIATENKKGREGRIDSPVGIRTQF